MSFTCGWTNYTAGFIRILLECRAVTSYVTILNSFIHCIQRIQWIQDSFDSEKKRNWRIVSRFEILEELFEDSFRFSRFLNHAGEPNLILPGFFPDFFMVLLFQKEK